MMDVHKDPDQATAEEPEQPSVFPMDASDSVSTDANSPSLSLAKTSYARRLLNCFHLPSLPAVFSDKASGISGNKDASPPTILVRVFRLGPLSGLLSMLLAMLSIFASLGILTGSDGQSATIWTTPPSTYLAVFTALANLCVRYAATVGVVIAWWTRSMKGGDLAKLHTWWRRGTKLHSEHSELPALRL